VTCHAGLVLRDKSQTKQQHIRALEDNSMAGTSAQDMSGATTLFVVFREFPWPNGIVLQGARMEEEVQSWLAKEPGQHPDIRRDLFEVSEITAHPFPDDNQRF
jgi:hypothetical protein